MSERRLPVPGPTGLGPVGAVLILLDGTAGSADLKGSKSALNLPFSHHFCSFTLNLGSAGLDGLESRSWAPEPSNYPSFFLQSSAFYLPFPRQRLLWLFTRCQMLCCNHQN